MIKHQSPITQSCQGMGWDGVDFMLIPETEVGPQSVLSVAPTLTYPSMVYTPSGLCFLPSDPKHRLTIPTPPTNLVTITPHTPTTIPTLCTTPMAAGWVGVLSVAPFH